MIVIYRIITRYYLPVELNACIQPYLSIRTIVESCAIRVMPDQDSLRAYDFCVIMNVNNKR